MEFSEIISLSKDIIQIIVFTGGFFIALFMFFQFAPKIEPRILPQWIEGKTDLCILKITIENKSKVRIKLNRDNPNKDAVLLQVLECSSTESLSEWVSFTEEAWRKQKDAKEWREPNKICETTEYSYPGEVVSVERLIKSNPNSVLHIGLQVKADLSWFGKLASRVLQRNQRWTSTAFVIRPDVQKL